MRKLFRTYLPGHAAVSGNRWLAPFSRTLLHPRLWHLNRRSAAGAVAAGLFCGLIPGPVQMLGAALACLIFRVNLPLALLTTLYTNPLTIVPLYLVAFELGQLLPGVGGHFVAPPELALAGVLDPARLGAWLTALLAWMTELGRPLFFGLLMLACLLAGGGYLVVRGLWRLYLVRAWHARRGPGGRP